MKIKKTIHKNWARKVSSEKSLKIKIFIKNFSIIKQFFEEQWDSFYNNMTINNESTLKPQKFWGNP